MLTDYKRITIVPSVPRVSWGSFGWAALDVVCAVMCGWSLATAVWFFFVWYGIAWLVAVFLLGRWRGR